MSRSRKTNGGRATTGAAAVPYYVEPPEREAAKYLRLTAARFLTERASSHELDEAIKMWHDSTRIPAPKVVMDEIEGRSADEGVLDKTKRSLTWWDEHTVIRLVVTHLNEQGARVLFTMPGRGLSMVATNPEQAERQLAFARKRWPEGVYEVHEVRCWRDADDRPGNPVHTLVDDTLTPSSR
jgi:hypothetical protein